MREKMKRALFFLFLAINILFALSISSFTVSATSNSDSVNLIEANVVWEKTYGGAGDDRTYYAAAVTDGFVVVGTSTSFRQGETVAWVLRLDSEGDVVWNETFLEGDGCELRSVLSLDDGFLLVGNVFLPLGDSDGYVVKVDAEGKTVWNITLAGEGVDKLFSAVRTQDGFVLVGLTYLFGGDSDVWVVKIDGDGDEAWSKTYGGAIEDAGRAVASTGGSDYVVAGYTNSMGNGDYDFLLLKLDSSGNMLWNKTYGGVESDKAYAMVEAAGGYVVVGDTRSKGAGESDAWVIKVDADGNLVWDKTVGGEGFDMPTCVTVSGYEGFLVGGFTFSFGNGERDFWLFKVDDSGNVLWSCTVGRTAFEEAYAALEVAENEFVMAGWTNSIGQGYYDFYVVKISVGNKGLLADDFLVSAVILSAILILVLIVAFYLVKRYVNRRISKNVNAVYRRAA